MLGYCLGFLVEADCFFFFLDALSIEDFFSFDLLAVFELESASKAIFRGLPVAVSRLGFIFTYFFLVALAAPLPMIDSVL